MFEILVWGDITKEFARLGISPRKTYQSTGRRDDLSVWELTIEEFATLDRDNDEEHWLNAGCGWRWSEGSTLGTPEYYPIVNRHRLLGWPIQFYQDERVGGPYDDLLGYLENAIRATTERNIAAVSTHLAKANGLPLAQLWQKYQG